MSNRKSIMIALLGLSVCVACAAQSQRVGQNARVQHGVVRNAQQVELDSNAAQGAIVGGLLGLASGGGRSSRRARNSIIGAGAGAALTGAAEGSRAGMSYTVEKPDGSIMTIVTDQQGIKPGDCVAVEQVGETANIRRTANSYCDKANQRAVSSVADHAAAAAVACSTAKQELVDATTTEAVDIATRKIELLCNG
ncbi:MAG TPA: hypothetical protein VK025_15720 [Steroidobacter sp.]|jgi:hypothetical protein|nr:hypothetical protein [Steroidobacter sp.]